MIIFSRRGILSGASALGFTAASGLLGTMGRAHAADTSGYKALVCLFLKGGMDCADTVLPTDKASHDALGEARGDLWSAYGVGSGTSSRDTENILALDTARGFGGRGFGLPQELRPLHDLYKAGRMALVGNVGPLVEPVTRDRMDSGTAALPPRLFSHNDQQSMWMSGGLEGRRLGWGGQFADRVAPSSGTGLTFAAITADKPETFLRGDRTRQYPGRRQGPVKLGLVEDAYRLGNGNDAAREVLRKHFASEGRQSSNMLRRDLIAGNQRTQGDNATYKAAVEGAPELATVFPDTHLGRQLATVATSISIRGTLGTSRQVFYAEMGGFDTHASQATNLPKKQREMADAVRAFDDAMIEMGLSESVTLFTASDFGRTVLGNGDGTDHGWGNHHFVIGGAVRGGEIYGELPPFDFGLQSYTKTRGRLIPDTSVDQYAATLGRWFGLSDGDMADALPNLGNFDARDLGFMVGTAA